MQAENQYEHKIKKKKQIKFFYQNLVLLVPSD